MRNVIGLLVVLLMCAALSSCSSNRPEKAFMGMWEGTHGEYTLELSFMEKDVFAWKIYDQAAGTWTIDPEGNAVMILEDEGEVSKMIAKLLSGGKIVVLPEGKDSSDARVFEKSDSKGQ